MLMGTAAVAGLVANPALPDIARAQALQPVVDVCTGISLEPSAVTDIVADVAVPTAAAVESLYDELLTISVLGAPLLTLADVDIGAEATLEAYANGDPIALRVADTSGTLLAPDSDCNLTADGYTLDEASGIAIGGNQISGLGTGLVASAAEADAIAFGDNASTGAGATGSIAIGADSSVTAANSVAIGADSLADRGALTGYTAPGVSGSLNSVGTVSVGSAGNLRQITNVAAGTQASDAATVGQVQGALDAVDDLADLAVQYDGATQSDVTLGGVGGTTIANLADGELSATSDEAVNGSQLFATNQQVAVNDDAIAGLDTRVTVNEGDIATLDGRLTVNEGDIAALENSAVQYDDASNTQVTLKGAGGTTVSNVAAGTLASTSTDAVNGSQLFATNQRVGTNEINIQANADAIAALDATSDGSALAVLYDDATRTSITLDGAGGTTVGNVADGEVSASSDDAVNGSQLFATNQQVATNADAISGLGDRVTVNEGDIANLGDRVTVNAGDIANLDGRVTINEGDIANLDDRVVINAENITDLGDNVTILGERVTENTTQIAVVQEQIDNVPVGYVSDSDPTLASDVPTNTAAMVGAAGDPVRLTNVAAGNVAAGSTDAVNGTQLASTNDAVARNRTDIDQNTAGIAALNNNIAGSTVVAVQYSDPGNPTQSNGGRVTNDVALVGADAAQPVALHNVADGRLANDAVNLGQLQSGISSAVADAQTYTDARFNDLQAGLNRINFNLDELRKDSAAGTASAMAFAGIPQTIEVGRSMIGSGVAYYQGEAAVSFGISSTFGDGHGVIKAGATIDTRGNGGLSAGAGISF